MVRKVRCGWRRAAPAGPGSDFSEAPASGLEPAALEFSSRPRLSSQVRRSAPPAQAFLVVDELAVDDVGQRNAVMSRRRINPARGTVWTWDSDFHEAIISSMASVRRW